VSSLLSVGVILSGIVWHELAHMVAAKRYGVYEATVLFRHPHKLVQFVLCGVAVGIGDDVSRRTEWAVSMAPLVYAPVAAALWILSQQGVEPAFTLSLIAAAAAVITLASDVPMLLTGGAEYDGWKLTVLDGELQ
jgi:chromate transport protein ChrA